MHKMLPWPVCYETECIWSVWCLEYFFKGAFKPPKQSKMVKNGSKNRKPAILSRIYMPRYAYAKVSRNNRSKITLLIGHFKIWISINGNMLFHSISYIFGIIQCIKCLSGMCSHVPLPSNVAIHDLIHFHELNVFLRRILPFWMRILNIAS